MKRVETRWIEQNKDADWGAIDRRWLAVVSHAEAVLAHFEHGQAGNRWEREAAKAVVGLAAEVTPREIVTTVSAVYLHAKAYPRFYVNDRAFRFQLVRAVRRLTRANAGTWFDHTSGRTKLVYRDPHPRATEIMSEWLVQALGTVGVYLQKREEREGDKQQREHEAFQQALASIT